MTEDTQQFEMIEIKDLVGNRNFNLAEKIEVLLICADRILVALKAERKIGLKKEGR